MNSFETVFLLAAEARSSQATSYRSRRFTFSPIWSCGASPRTGVIWTRKDCGSK